jgi:hypothetical protein
VWDSVVSLVTTRLESNRGVEGVGFDSRPGWRAAASNLEGNRKVMHVPP